MEENVALDTSKQKQFVKSIKGIKKLIKKAEGDVPEILGPKQKNEKIQKRKRPARGLVYLSHIPHGFYEHEMTQYFSQFGSVTNVRVIRSKRTGNSKGCGFVEFKQPDVAEIVAETMNNYLMGKRLLKAAVIPPEKQKVKAMRKHWNRLNNPTRTERLKQKKAYNENKDNTGELARARRYLSNYRKNMKKLSNIGINYDFFTPVDIPTELERNLNPAENNSSSKKDSQNKDNKEQKNKENKQTAPKKKEKEEKKQVDSKKDKKTKVSTEKKNEDIKETEQKLLESKKGKKTKTPEPVVNKKEQKQKQLKLKNAGVKAPENFMQIPVEGDSDSDESADFNSDDYSKIIEDDSDADSEDNESDNEEESDDESGGGDDDDDDDDGSDIEQGTNDEGESDDFEITGSDDDESDVVNSEDEEIILPAKKGKGNPKGKGLPIPPQPVQKKAKGPNPPIVSAQKKQAKTVKQTQSTQQMQSKSNQNKGSKATVDQIGPKVKGPKAEEKVPKVEQKGQKGPAQQKRQQAPELGKRKAPQKTDVSPKKPKFEKQTQQPMKKQFKKKK